MLRLLFSGLILSSPITLNATRRTGFAIAATTRNNHLLLGSRGLSNTCPARANQFELHETMVEAGKKEEEALPKLSAQEFRIYNGMADHMDLFHNNFRNTWNVLYGACESGKRPGGMSIRAFLAAGADFCHHLTVHHSIEEQHIFPLLARKMPAFKKELELLTQHKQIHKGLDQFEKYIEDCKTGERELRLEEMKAVMETFGTVLWQHLDDEVRQLGAENMRKYWTVDEMRRMPM